MFDISDIMASAHGSLVNHHSEQTVLALILIHFSNFICIIAPLPSEQSVIAQVYCFRKGNVVTDFLESARRFLLESFQNHCDNHRQIIKVKPSHSADRFFPVLVASLALKIIPLQIELLKLCEGLQTIRKSVLDRLRRLGRGIFLNQN